MAEEGASATVGEQTAKLTEKVEETAKERSVEATMESAADGAAESTCNNVSVGETSCVSADEDREKTAEFSDELMDRGRNAFKDGDYTEASDCFSRALEIRLGFSFYLLHFVISMEIVELK